MTDHTTHTPTKKTRNRTRQPLEQRFWKFVNKTDTCWLWTGATRGFGYGAINTGGKNGKTEAAHRASWLIHFGDIPNDLCICHHCDNPLCVRPDHLFLGTRADNNHDMQNKGRASGGAQGEKHHQSKLTQEQVVEIRTAFHKHPAKLQEIANQYGVTLQTIQRLIQGDSWQSAGGPTNATNRRIGESNNHAVLTIQEVRAIRTEFATGKVSQKSLADKYHVSTQAIFNIVHRRTWKHI
jgi:predicted DNA-binding protein YlxM (UPF0122 family)